MNPSRGGWLIGLTLFLALVLSVVHLPSWWPEWLGYLRPHWIAIFVFFWVLHFPNRLGLIWAWVVGLLQDVLLADPLGLNAIVLAAITFITWKLYERLRMYSLPQQCSFVFMLVLWADGVRALVHVIVLDRDVSLLLVVPALVSALIWPMIEVVLLRLARQFQVE